MLYEDTNDQVSAVYRTIDSKRLEETPCAADYNQSLVKLVNAIVSQSTPDMLAALRAGVIRANDLFPSSVMSNVTTGNLSGSSSWTIEFAVAGNMPPSHRGTRGKFLTWEDLGLPFYLAYNVPTPLGIAILFGNADAVRTLVRAGAQPWPSPEALLNMALTRLTVTDHRVPGMGKPAIYRTHPADVIRALLEAFPRSRTLGPYDFNPLSVARMVTDRANAFSSANNNALVMDLFREVIPLLLAAGYTPTERIQDIGWQFPSLWATLDTVHGFHAHARESSTWIYAHDSEQRNYQAIIERTRTSELEGAQEDLREALHYVQEDIPPSPERLVPYVERLQWLLQQYAKIIARPTRAHYALALPAVRAGTATVPLMALSSSRSPPAFSHRPQGRPSQVPVSRALSLQTQTPYGGNPLAGLSQLPTELQAMIIEQPTLSNRDIAALAASGRNLAEAVALTAEGSTVRARELVQSSGACQDYIGCMRAFVYAIATDDVDTVEAILRTRRVRLDQYIDPAVVCGRSRNGVVLCYHAPIISKDLWQEQRQLFSENGTRSVLPSEGNVPMWVTQAFDLYPGRNIGGNEPPYGSPYVSPLALAVALKAPRVLRYMIRNGAQPWPNMPTVLAFAMMYPVATHVTVLAYGAQCDLSKTSTVQWGYLDVDNPDTLHRSRGDPPNLTRPVDTALIVRILLEAFGPNDPSLGPWNITPLTIMRDEALSFVRAMPPGYLDTVRAGSTLIAIMNALFGGGYSPLQRSIRCAPVTEADLHASLDRPTEWRATHNEWTFNGSHNPESNVGFEIDVIMNMYARHLLASNSFQ